MHRTSRVDNRWLSWKLASVLGTLVSLACLALLPDPSDNGMEPEGDRPERVSIARLLAQLTPMERHPGGMFFRWQPAR